MSACLWAILLLFSFLAGNVASIESASEPESGDTFYSYDPVGNLQQVLYPNEVATLYRYDHLYRLTNMVSGRNGNTIADYHYTVAPSGHRLTASEAIVAATNNLREVNRAYGYDNLYRLTGENLTAAGVTNLPPSASVAYTHDNVGNRLTRTSNLPGVESQSFGYNANDWILTDTYDNNGNTIQGRVIQSLPTVADQYDYEDRLISRNNGQVTIVYDGDGNRVRKTVNGITTLYLVDDRNPTGYAQVLEELTSTGGTPAVTRLYVYGADLIAQQQLNGNNQWEATFYGYDAHGNTRYLTDLSGNVTDTYDYDAFGDLIAQTGTTPNLYLYCREQFDQDLGFYYLRARYLNADSGRFWTRDTFEGFVDDPFSRHVYQFAKSQPTFFIDPSGNVTIPESALVDHIRGMLNSTLNQTTYKIIRDKAGCYLIEIVAEEAIAGVVLEGLYLFAGQTDKGYAGRSQDIDTRLKQHGNRVKQVLAKFLFVAETDMEMRQMEQWLIDKLKDAAGLNPNARLKGNGGILNQRNEVNKTIREKMKETFKFCK